MRDHWIIVHDVLGVYTDRGNSLINFAPVTQQSLDAAWKGTKQADVIRKLQEIASDDQYDKFACHLYRNGVNVARQRADAMIEEFSKRTSHNHDIPGAPVRTFEVPLFLLREMCSQLDAVDRADAAFRKAQGRPGLITTEWVACSQARIGLEDAARNLRLYFERV